MLPVHWIVTKLCPVTPNTFSIRKEGTSQPPGNPTPALRQEARTWLLGPMSIGYAHGFSGHNLGPRVVDLGAGLLDPGSVQ